MNVGIIRRLNTARIFHALREKPDSSQREIIEHTGLDKATVSTIVRQFESDGLLERVPKPKGGRVGRPEFGLRVSSDAGLLVGVHLEPGIIRMIAATLDGKVVRSLEVKGSKDADRALDLFYNGVSRLIDKCGVGYGSVHGLGVGIPALMDTDGNIVFYPNLGWQNIPILDLLRARFACPVYVDNDTNAATLAEKLFGASQDAEDFVFVTSHSGVGGGLYLGGNLYRGPSGLAGELGHVRVFPNGRLCECGGQGCVAAYITEPSLKRRLHRMNIPVRNIRAIAKLAEAENQQVLQVLEEAGESLGYALTSVINILNPPLIVLGGHLALIADFILPSVRRVVDRNALTPVHCQTKIIISPLRTESVPMGGVALALEGYLALPGWIAASELT